MLRMRRRSGTRETKNNKRILIKENRMRKVA